MELSRRTRLIKNLVADINQMDRFTDLRLSRFSESEIDRVYKYPNHIDSEVLDMGNFKMLRLSSKEGGSDWVTLMFHGGGYCQAFKRNYNRVAGYYHEVSRGGTVFAVDYRVAPEYVFPAALDDAMAAYDYLIYDLNIDSSRIILSGDSAGGGLALALVHLIRSQWKKLPAGIVVMSPWADLTTSRPSYVNNKEIDPVFGGGNDELIFNNPYPGETDKKDIRISPLFGDFSGFPPMLVQAGSDEMLLSDSEELYLKAKSQGVQVRFTVYQGMFHVFQLGGKLMEESKEAWREVGRFYESL